MILEGIVTTQDLDGRLNVAPMGPTFEDDPGKVGEFLLRPFKTASTFRNLKVVSEGVFHVTDDALLLARAAIGPVEHVETFPAETIRGRVIAGACRFFEFQVASLDDREERSTIVARITRSGRLRDFLGFNRAKHAVLEAAILATRLSFLPRTEVLAEFSKLAILVEKTGGPADREAFALLLAHVNRS